jgi:hypothetical protein
MDRAYTIKYSTASPIITDDELRERLVAAYAPDPFGDVATAQPPTADVHASPLRSGGHKIPNLRPAGRWDGRMRRVTIHKFKEESQSGAMKVGWEGVLWTIAYEQTVDMPWPYWKNLENTDFIDNLSDAVTKWTKNEETGVLSVERGSRRIKTVRYTDHGDKPGTESLPEDYKDHFTREAKRTNCFEGFNRSALMLVHNILLEPYGEVKSFNATYFRDMKDIDLRIKISQALGPEIESMMNDCVYALEEAS